MKHVQDIRREHDYWLTALVSVVDMEQSFQYHLAMVNGLRFALDLPHLTNCPNESMKKQLEGIKFEEREA